MIKRLKALILVPLLLVAVSPAYGVNLTAANASTSIFEIEYNASPSDVNGGFFNPANPNSMTDLSCTNSTTASPVCSSATAVFTAATTDVGAWVYISATTGTGGTFVIGWYKIASIDGSHNATLTAGVGTAVRLLTTGMPSPHYGANTTQGIGSVDTAITAGHFLVDYSQSTTAQVSGIHLSCSNASPSLCTDTSVAFVNKQVGNGIHITTTGNLADFLVGWYELASFSAGTMTLDRDAVSVADTLANYNVGGAVSLGDATASQSDATFFLQGNNATTNSSRFFVKYGASPLTLAALITGLTAGGTEAPIVIEGYNTLRGDAPTGANRPTIAGGASYHVNTPTAWDHYHLIYTSGFTNYTLYAQAASGNFSRLVNVKVVNSNVTAGTYAIQTSTGYNYLQNVEAISYRGTAFNAHGYDTCIGCYFHDSNIGVLMDGTTAVHLIDTVVESNVAYAIQNTGIIQNHAIIIGSTLYGAENKTGVGVSWLSGTAHPTIFNTIIYGFVTGVTHADAGQVGSLDDFNDYYNNTTPATNWPQGTSDLAVSPQFTNVHQFVNTAGTVATATGVLNDSLATFTSDSITANRDFVYILGGATAGQYLITAVNSATQLAISPDPGTHAAVTYQITTGHNFGIGTNLKAAGWPGTYPGAVFTSFTDMGAVQRQEPVSGASQHNSAY